MPVTSTGWYIPEKNYQSYTQTRYLRFIHQTKQREKLRSYIYPRKWIGMFIWIKIVECSTPWYGYSVVTLWGKSWKPYPPVWNSISGNILLPEIEFHHKLPRLTSSILPKENWILNGKDITLCRWHLLGGTYLRKIINPIPRQDIWDLYIKQNKEKNLGVTYIQESE